MQQWNSSQRFNELKSLAGLERFARVLAIMYGQQPDLKAEIPIGSFQLVSVHSMVAIL